MRTSSRAVNKLCKDLKFNNTYLDKDDVQQEALIALFVAKNLPRKSQKAYIQNHVHEVVAKSTSFHFSIIPVNDPIDYIIEIESQKKLMKVLRILIDRCSDEQKIVLKLIYGLLDGRCHDYDEISLMFKLPVDKIKEIEHQAICTIRASSGLEQIFRHLIK